MRESFIVTVEVDPDAAPVCAWDIDCAVREYLKAEHDVEPVSIAVRSTPEHADG